MPKGVSRGHENDPPGICRAVDIAIRVMSGKRVPRKRRESATLRLQQWLDTVRQYGRERKRRMKQVAVNDDHVDRIGQGHNAGD